MESPACNIIQYNQFCCGLVMVLEGISFNGCKDLHVLANGIFTAVWYWDKMPIAIVNPVSSCCMTIPGLMWKVCGQFLGDEGINAIE